MPASAEDSIEKAPRCAGMISRTMKGPGPRLVLERSCTAERAFGACIGGTKIVSSARAGIAAPEWQTPRHDGVQFAVGRGRERRDAPALPYGIAQLVRQRLLHSEEPTGVPWPISEQRMPVPDNSNVPTAALLLSNRMQRIRREAERANGQTIRRLCAVAQTLPMRGANIGFLIPRIPHGSSNDISENTA